MAQRDSRGRFVGRGGADAFITVSVNSADIDRVVAEITARASDFSPVTPTIADEYAAQLHRNIDALDGPPLSEKYAKQKAIKHPGKGFARATDALYNSIRPLDHGPLTASAGSEGIDYALFEDARYGISEMPTPLIQFTLEVLGRHLVGGAS